MSNYQVEERQRGQNLLIVEGNHEKNKLFWLIFKCFSEIHFDMDLIWIYGTNIYQLSDWVKKQSYVHRNQTYWEYMRGIFRQIIQHNICKANRILYEQYKNPTDRYRECFERLIY